MSYCEDPNCRECRGTAGVTTYRNPFPKRPAHITARQWKKAIKKARRDLKEMSA